MKVTPPDISINLDINNDPFAQLNTVGMLVDSRIEHADLSKLKVDAVSIRGSVISKTTFAGCHTERSDLMDVRLNDCDFTTSRSQGSSWRRVVIKSCRLSGIQLQQSKLEDIVFESCKLDLANMRLTELKRVVFIDCMMTGCDFYGARLQRVSFEHCTLDQAEFSQTKMFEVDFRSSDISNINGVTSIKGAVISQEQLYYMAPTLAAQLGINVTE